jgi:hypothetical protein
MERGKKKKKKGYKEVKEERKKEKKGKESYLFVGNLKKGGVSAKMPISFRHFFFLFRTTPVLPCISSHTLVLNKAKTKTQSHFYF